MIIKLKSTLSGAQAEQLAAAHKAFHIFDGAHTLITSSFVMVIIQKIIPFSVLGQMQE